MSDGALPAFLVRMIGVVREAVSDEVVDAMKRQVSLWCVGDSHTDHGDIAVRRFSHRNRSLSLTGSAGIWLIGKFRLDLIIILKVARPSSALGVTTEI